MLFEPQELLAAMPPKVQRAWVLGSTGKNWPVDLRAALRWPRTRPGSTQAVSPSTDSTRRRWGVQSITRARLTVCPHWLVPPPRGSTGTPASRAMAMAASTSAIVRGANTPTGSIW